MSAVLHALDGQQFQPSCRRTRPPSGSRWQTTRLAARVTCTRCLRLIDTDRGRGRVGLLVRGFVPDDYDEDESRSMRTTASTEAQAEQKLWIARWGTQTGLVWATDEQWAEARVRRRAFDRRMARHRVIAQPQAVDGPVSVRLATKADLALWEEAAGPAVKGAAAAF